MSLTKRAKQIIQSLNLQFLNLEAGLFNLVRVSDIEINSAGEQSAASNAIYMMLNTQVPINYVQWLYSDDYHVLIEGGPADYYLFFEDGSSQKLTMGRELDKQQHMMVTAPGGTAKAIVLHEDVDFILIGSVLSPAWSPHRARIGADQRFVDKFTGSSPWATAAFLRKLVGPNFGVSRGGKDDFLDLALQADGQITWQGMQLSLKQLRQQILRFQSQDPDTPIHLQINDLSPPETINKIVSLARETDANLHLSKID
jgi:predicted cupin superfamily sugar epimerase